MKLRFAAGADAPALLAIYERYIPISAVYPYLVLEEEGAALGYAYAHRVAERAAYSWGAELSIYLHPKAAGQGAGRRLYQALMELLRLPGGADGVRPCLQPQPGQRKAP